jgi:hypothetical protein
MARERGSWLSWTLGVLTGVLMCFILQYELSRKPAFGGVFDERQGMVTATASAHAAVEARVDTLTHEDLHAEPLRKGDRLQ